MPDPDTSQLVSPPYQLSTLSPEATLVGDDLRSYRKNLKGAAPKSKETDKEEAVRHRISSRLASSSTADEISGNDKTGYIVSILV